jgi:hypothetical protein
MKRILSILFALILLIVCFVYINIGKKKAKWQTAELIETNVGNALSPQVAMDSDGNAIATWYQWDGTRYIWANRYVKGTGWQIAERIETDDVADGFYPQVAMDSYGNAVATWQQNDATRNNIWANRYVKDTGWQTPELIETDNTGSAFPPQLAMDSSGNAIATWPQRDGTRYNIWANRYVAGTGWQTSELIETNAENAGFPQVAMDSNGNAVATWSQNSNIRANRYVAGTGWQTPELIETNAGNASSPQVAMDSDGNAIATWQQSDATRLNIWASRYVAGTGWQIPELVETNAGNAGYPQLAMDLDGNAIATWQQNDGTRNNIWANRYVADTGWQTPELIETDNAGNTGSPQVAMDPNGNAIAIWYQNDGTRNNIWANRYVKDTGWQTAKLIETNIGNASSPQVAMDPDGNAIATWHQSDGTRNNIWANRYGE